MRAFTRLLTPAPENEAGEELRLLSEEILWSC